MSTTPQQRPDPVPSKGKPSGEDTAPTEQVRQRFPYASASAWTERMLTTLEEGMNGRAWYSLIDKVYNPANLREAWDKVHANDGAAGVDHMTVGQFDKNAPAELEALSRKLKEGRYEPSPVRRVHIPKPGTTQTRPLGIPTVRDRVVQGALRHVLEPIFEISFADQSYGFRPGRGCKDALRRVDGLLKKGWQWVVDVDLQSYFDSIPHDQLLMRIKQKVADGRVLSLVEKMLKQGVMEGLVQWTPMSGAPQGAVLSPLLSNIYLDPLDHLLAAKGHEMIRYADDLVVMCRSREDAERALALIGEWVESAGLKLHPQKTRLVNAAEEGFDFLGYRFESGKRKPRDKSLQRLRESVRDKTGRNNGFAMQVIVMKLNLTLRGWFGYFQHSDRRCLKDLDGWIRRRLRSILRQRKGQRGRSGWDNLTWPNAYFREMGLYSLYEAQLQKRQSVVRR